MTRDASGNFLDDELRRLKGELDGFGRTTPGYFGCWT